MALSISKLEDIIGQVDSHKVSAETNKAFEDYTEALNDLQAAIDLLDPKLEELEAADPKDVERLQPWRLRFARELADCYGMRGGNYRRLGKLERAEEMYEKGSDLEEKYAIPDTYNRTNFIVLQLLRAPNRHEALGSMIVGARDIVQDQVNGKNINKWWTWADFGLLNLLSVNLKATERQTPEETEDSKKHHQETAHRAYRRFKETGAEREHFQSTISVLEQLYKGFKEIDEATASLIKVEIAYLNENMPER